MLPIFQTSSKELNMLQTNWASQLNPMLSNPAAQSILLKNIPLASGLTVVNHKLGRVLQGWKIVRQRASASIYDTQDSNQNPELTLFLNSSANVTVDLEVF